MAQARRSREEKKQATRDAILESAATLFAEEGIERTSLEQIAEHAGYTKGAVYSNFASKHELIMAVGNYIESGIDIRDFIGGKESLSDEFYALGVEVTDRMRTVSQRDWRLNFEMFFYALRDETRRESMAEGARVELESDGRYVEEVARARGESLPLPGPELMTVLSALSLGLALREAMDPKVVSDDLVARALRLLAGGDVLS